MHKPLMNVTHVCLCLRSHQQLLVIWRWLVGGWVGVGGGGGGGGGVVVYPLHHYVVENY